MNHLLINVVFPGEPIAWERINPRGFKPKKTRQAQAALVRGLKCVAPKLEQNSRLRFGVQLIFSTASGRKDGDNCEKLLLDAFNGKIWQDDSQIDECRWKMIRHAEIPRTHLIVYTID
jgi:Holliday junction resolvase RusA-like endonuclease